jgi:hypothetical protein
MPQVDSGLIRAVAVVLAAALSWGRRCSLSGVLQGHRSVSPHG